MKRALALAWTALLLLSACGEGDARRGASPGGSSFAGAFEGLSSDEVARFAAGRAEFLEVETAAEGLGPLFNASSCAQCHSLPSVGGAGVSTVVRAGFVEEDGSFREPPGGSLIHLFSTRPDLGTAMLPEGASVIARRRTPPLFGAGLMEAIPDDAIVAQADATGKPEGVAGRVNLVTDVATGLTRVGRFGWKAQQASLLTFNAEAYRTEVGITNELFGEEIAPNGDAALLNAMDWVPDPEAQRGVITMLADFTRFLAPLPRGEVDATVEAGESLFAAVGCGSCHHPSYTTGPSDSPVLDEQVVALYSDLLLHDVGSGDGIAQAGAGRSELRTPPLWGLRHRAPYLHDGSAADIAAAIARHAGEAEGVRQAYDALSDNEREAVQGFLQSL